MWRAKLRLILRSSQLPKNKSSSTTLIVSFIFFYLFLAYLEKGRVLFIRSQKKNAQLVHNGYIYNKKIALSNGKTTWRCADLLKKKCKAVCITKDNQLVAMRRSHCHDHHWEKIIPKDLYYEEEDLDELIEIRPSESLPITEILKTSQLEIVDGAYKVIVPPLNAKPATSGQPVPKMKN